MMCDNDTMHNAKGPYRNPASFVDCGSILKHFQDLLVQFLNFTSEIAFCALCGSPVAVAVMMDTGDYRAFLKSPNTKNVGSYSFSTVQCLHKAVCGVCDHPVIHHPDRRCHRPVRR